MKKLGVIALALSILAASSDINAAEAPSRSLRITSGEIVTTVPLPTPLDASNPAMRASTVVVGDTGAVLTGHATLRIGEELFTASADQITTRMQNQRFSDITLQGRVVMKVRQSNGQVTQITVDNAVVKIELAD